MLGKLRALLPGHAKADQQILLIGKVGLDIVLVAPDGIRVSLRPRFHFIGHALEHDIKFILHFLDFGGQGNAILDCGADSGDGKADTNRAQRVLGKVLQLVDALFGFALG